MKKLRFVTTAVLLACIFQSAKPYSPYNPESITDSIEIKIDTMIAHLGLTAETPGGVVGVIKDGRLIFKKAYGLADFGTREKNNTSLLFNLGSASKQFTAAAVLLLEKEKKLSLKDDIRKYLPDFPDYGYTITIENLIHHTSGIKSFDVLKLMAGTLFSKESQDDVYSLIIKQKSLNFRPGDEFLYSNSGYALLVKIIEKASGMTFSKYVEEKIFQPAGMNHSFIYDNSSKIIENKATGHTWGGDERFKKSDIKSTVVGVSNVYTCLEDFLLWDKNFYNNKLGKWDFGHDMKSLTTLNSGDTCKYAFGLEISEHNGLRSVSHQGGTGDFTAQYIQIPSEKFAVVCLFNIPTDVESLAYKITDLFVKGNRQTDNVSLLPQMVIVDTSVLKTYTGKYFDETKGIELNITREDDHLVFDALYHGRLEIYPFTDTSFFTKVADIKISFTKDVKGEITKATIIQGDQNSNLIYLGKNLSAVKPEQIDQFPGNFYCEELDVTYPVILKDNKLYVTFPESTAKYCSIKPENELLFQHGEYFDSPVGAFMFTRNAKNEVSGFILKDVGRVRNLVFSKTN